MKRTTAAGAAIALLGLMAGCGGSGGDDEAEASGGGGAVEVASMSEVTSCLQAAGLDAETSTDLDQTQKDAFGVVDSLDVTGRGDLVGIGSVTWHEDADTAEDALEASRAVRTDQVALDVVGSVTYDYAGGDRAQSDRVAEIIVGCL